MWRSHSFNTNALCALMCFHSARLETKTNAENELLDLKNQDRSQWYFPLIKLGNAMMYKAVDTPEFSCYHYEAAIAAEHLRAYRFEDTNWDKILHWYECLNTLQPMPTHLLTMAVVCIQNKDYVEANNYLKQLSPNDFAQRAYLYYATIADYYSATNNLKKAICFLDRALETVNNLSEKDYLQKKKSALSLDKE